LGDCGSPTDCGRFPRKASTGVRLPLADSGRDGPRRVAPGRMPKAEATGLAPLLIGTSRTLEYLCSGVFYFDGAISGWWSFRAEALGLENAKAARRILPGAIARLKPEMTLKQAHVNALLIYHRVAKNALVPRCRLRLFRPSND
jgi:hypothetical protein